MDANSLLWAGQVVLALALLTVGYGHSIGFDQWVLRQGMGWLAAVGKPRMRVIGGLEILGAIGLVLPGLLGILPWLTPVAATCVAVLMVLAAIFHAGRPGERTNIALNIFNAVLAGLIAWGRFVVAPF
ncbi:MAG: DoxX family protein [Candidatus Limnocylindrales bacterium]